jgi:hypothetical protein
MKARARDGTCRRREEEKARRERKWKKDMQVLEGILELKVANEMAEFAGQFFEFVEHGSSQTPVVSTSALIDLINIHENNDAVPPDTSQNNLTNFQSPLFLESNHVGPIYESE